MQSCPCAFFLSEHRAHKAYWASGCVAPYILDPGTWWRWVVSSTLPRERAPGTHWVGDWVGSTAGLDAVVKEKIPSSYRDSNPRSSSPLPSAIPLPRHEVRPLKFMQVNVNIIGVGYLSIYVSIPLISAWQSELNFRLFISAADWNWGDLSVGGKIILK
jgi:hypothetical protein